MLKSLPFLLVLYLLIPSSACADTTVRVSWTETFDRISPDLKPGMSQTKNLSLTLKDNKMASEAYSVTSGKSFAKNWTAALPLVRDGRSVAQTRW
jgi:hypothetical protein